MQRHVVLLMAGLTLINMLMITLTSERQLVHCADTTKTHLTKLEHLDIHSLLLKLCQLVLGGGLVLDQLGMLMPELPLSCFQLMPVIC